VPEPAGLLTASLVERAVIEVGRGPIQLCSAAGGELIVALAGRDTVLTVLDGESAAVRSRLDVGRSPWNAVSDGTRVYVAMHTLPPADCLDAIQVVDCALGRVVATVPLPAGSRPKIVVPALDQGRVYSLNWGNGTLSEIDTGAHRVSRTVEVGGGPQYGQRFQDTLYVANGQSHDVAVVNEATLTVTHRVAVGGGPERCVVYKDHRQVYTNNLDDDTVSVVDVDSWRESARIPVGRGPIRITPWDSRGREEWAVLCRGSGDGDNGSIVLIDGATHRVTDVFRLPGPVANWNWGSGPRHQTVYVSLAGESSLVVIDAARLELLDTVQLSRQPEPAGFGPGIFVSKSGGVFVASEDSVTYLTRGSGEPTYVETQAA
jgi:YVTN family beta-propeller protein